jgi:hypothetical protein
MATAYRNMTRMHFLSFVPKIINLIPTLLRNAIHKSIYTDISFSTYENITAAMSFISKFSRISQDVTNTLYKGK